MRDQKKNPESDINFVHFSSSPGGIEVLLPVIISSTSNRSFNVFVIRKPKHDDNNVYRDQNIPIIYGSNRKLLAYVRLFNYARIRKKEIFHVYNIGPIFLIILRLAGVSRLVYSIHGTIYWKKNWHKYVIKFLWRLAVNNRIIFTSNTAFSKGVFNNIINNKIKIIVNYNPVDGDRFFPIKEIKSGPVRNVVYVGRLSEGKNLLLWVSIAVKLRTYYPELRFKIYGTGPLKDRIIELIKQVDAGNYISLEGFRQDIENVYREADLLLFLSEYESFGNVAVESILSGTPVLTSDIPSIREIFKDYPDFILDSDKSPFDLVVSRLIKINELRELAFRARKSFLVKYSIGNHINCLNTIYDSI